MCIVIVVIIMVIMIMALVMIRVVPVAHEPHDTARQVASQRFALGPAPHPTLTPPGWPFCVFVHM